MNRPRKEPAGKGHNSGGEVNAAHLQAFIERIERLNEEKRSFTEDIAEVFKEMKANGFDAKIVRKIIALRSMDTDKHAEQEALIEIYMAALGQLADTELGRSAIRRVSP